MAATLILDTKSGAVLDLDANEEVPNRRVRTGVVKDIVLDGTASDAQVLEKAATVVYAAVPLNSTFPGNANLFFTHLRVLPVAYDACRVFLYYEENQFATQSAYILRDRTYLGQVTRTFTPESDTPIKVGWVDPVEGTFDPGGDVAVSIGGNSVPDDYVPMSFLMPMRALNVSAIKFGNVPAGLQDLVGSVNHATWRSKARGFWLLTELETDIVRYSGYYSYSATAVSRVYKDWREIGVLQNRQTGRYVKISTTDLATLKGGAYTPGVQKVNGGVNVGPYPVANFAGVFGFS